MTEKPLVTSPPRGYLKHLATLAGCSTRTVITALRHNGRGEKADLVRKLFKANYAKYINK